MMVITLAAGAVLLLLLLAIYFVPTLIATKRKHHNKAAISVLNALLGWTALGWIAALVWSLTTSQPQAAPLPAAALEGDGKARDLRSLREEDFADCLVHYPHVPKAVNRFLQESDPGTYHDAAYTVLNRAGALVRVGDVIAKYGAFSITAPVEGRLEFVSTARPGLHEWPDSSTTRPNYGALVFDATAHTEAHSFSIRPVLPEDPSARWAWKKSEYPYFAVRPAFDRGDVWLDMKRGKGRSFYTVIDLLVYDLKSAGSGIALPPTLAGNQEYRQQLRRYWDLINHAAAEIAPSSARPA